jgi:hypothetical protein
VFAARYGPNLDIQFRQIISSTAQAVSRRPLIAEVPFWSRLSPCEICSAQSCTTHVDLPVLLFSPVSTTPATLRTHLLLREQQMCEAWESQKTLLFWKRGRGGNRHQTNGIFTSSLGYSYTLPNSRGHRDILQYHASATRHKARPHCPVPADLSSSCQCVLRHSLLSTCSITGGPSTSTHASHV